MPIITNIRKFFRLDKTTLLIATEFEDSVGLYMNEIKEFRKVEFYDCLGKHSYYAGADVAHSSHDFHFGHS
jgi:hypothetical protein